MTSRRNSYEHPWLVVKDAFLPEQGIDRYIRYLLSATNHNRPGDYSFGQEKGKALTIAKLVSDNNMTTTFSQNTVTTPFSGPGTIVRATLKCTVLPKELYNEKLTEQVLGPHGEMIRNSVLYDKFGNQANDPTYTQLVRACGILRVMHETLERGPASPNYTPPSYK